MRLAIDGGHGILELVGCLKVDCLWGLKSDKSFSSGVLEKDYAGGMTDVDPQWKI